MASLPSYGDEAGLHALDAKCENRHSHASTRSVVQLSKLSLSTKEDYLMNSLLWDLPHLVRCLIEAELSPDARVGEYNGTALHVTARNGRTRALKALLAGGANHSLVDERTMTPLHDTAHAGQIACLQLLLDAGANASVQDSLGQTPLMYAVMQKRADCARALLPNS